MSEAEVVSVLQQYATEIYHVGVMRWRVLWELDGRRLVCHGNTLRELAESIVEQLKMEGKK